MFTLVRGNLENVLAQRREEENREENKSCPLARTRMIIFEV
jgi:hypothetical protein